MPFGMCFVVTVPVSAGSKMPVDPLSTMEPVGGESSSSLARQSLVTPVPRERAFQIG